MEEQVEKPRELGWFWKVVRWFLPAKLKKYVTPEVVIAWNISSACTWGQAIVTFQGKWIVAHILVPGVALLKVAWDEILGFGKIMFEMVYLAK